MAHKTLRVIERVFTPDPLQQARLVKHRLKRFGNGPNPMFRRDTVRRLVSGIKQTQKRLRDKVAPEQRRFRVGQEREIGIEPERKRVFAQQARAERIDRRYPGRVDAPLQVAPIRHQLRVVGWGILVKRSPETLFHFGRGLARKRDRDDFRQFGLSFRQNVHHPPHQHARLARPGPSVDAQVLAQRRHGARLFFGQRHASAFLRMRSRS